MVISDNASMDNTEKIVNEYISVSPIRVKYFRQKQNMGFDMNVLKVVELAEGQYCSILGDDDKIIDGSIKKLLKEISSGSDIYLFNATQCNIKMKPLRNTLWVDSDFNREVYDLSNRNELMTYLNKSQSIGALFSYISSFIFKRSRWVGTKINECAKKSNFIHAYICLSFINNGCKLTYIKEPLVFARLGNDRIKKKDQINRFLIDIDTYLLFSEVFFSSDHELRKLFLKVISREHSFIVLLKIAVIINDKHEWEKVKSKLLKIGYDYKMIKRIDFARNLKIIIKPLLLFLINCKHKIKGD